MAYPSLSPGARLLAVHLRDQQGNLIGDVKEWMMDIEQGRVVYVLSTLGDTQGEYVAFPWPVLKPDREQGGYRINVDAERLQQAPRIPTDALASLVSNTEFLDQVFSFFQAQPYWQGGEQGQPQGEQANNFGGRLEGQVATKDEAAGQTEGQAQPNDLKETKDEQAQQGVPNAANQNQAIQNEGKGYE